MVTMIDGGLPVVAKSKPIHDKPKSAKARAQDASRDKVMGECDDWGGFLQIYYDNFRILTVFKMLSKYFCFKIASLKSL